jgi:glycosyltransferase involved in cell wall biosynthesis
MEAMAYSLPVVASRVTGHIDLIQHGINGFLFDLNKLEDAEKYIMELASNPSLFKLIGSNANKTIKSKFSAERMCERMMKVYNSFE